MERQWKEASAGSEVRAAGDRVGNVIDIPNWMR